MPCPPPGDLPNPWIEPKSPTFRQILFSLSCQGTPRRLEWVAYPFSGDLPNPGIGLESPAMQADSLPAELSGKPLVCIRNCSLHALTQNVKCRNKNRILFSFIFGCFFFAILYGYGDFLQYHWSLIYGSTVFRGCCVDSYSDSIFHLDKHKVSEFLSSEVSMVFSDTCLLVPQVEGPLQVHFLKIFSFYLDNCFTMLCLSLQQNNVNLIYIHISHPFTPHPSLLCCHRALLWDPCIIQQLPTSYLFYTW